MPAPRVSAIVPVYNDPGGIKTTLDSLTEQTYGNYEIIPVDNNSTDGTADVIRRWESQYPDRVVSAEETVVQSSYAARNTGVERASGDILLFIDADMWVAETWISEMVTALESRGCDYLGCDVEIISASDSPSLWERYERALSFPVEAYLERKRFAPTCALAVRRAVFDEIGPFDDQLVSGGDKEFGQRVHRAGFEQGYAGSITVFHPARDSFGALRSKARRIGRGRAQRRHYHPADSNDVHPLHPVRFLPPSPLRLYRRYSGTSASVPELLSYYVLEYGLKLIQTTSSLRETVALARGDS
ncbi:glycosyltransferase [Natrialba asiatica]|uniref:Rhamnosyl transferase n=1 Tax=Natrialba asiatica (strain ATCC 700177 / DSM 12278 / JCM 9576 / FERM P-10747 / NBRC 102637 / 172P1) TaxID=29540 RepID=M0AXJ9_NATA1|nr:glycosyltransferase [Natrialba asiatica]ELZ03022.1 rhamnosyl transferase [Natrialba asiatica DSM 12278]